MMDILFSGDIAIQNATNGFSYSDELLNVFSQYKHKVCNYEGPDAHANMSALKKIGPTIIQSFVSIDEVEKLGFDVYCLANNHIMDFGTEGLRQTINSIKSRGHNYIGAGFSDEEIYRPTVIEDNGLRIALFNAAEKSFGVCDLHNHKGHSWLFSEELINSIKKHKELCDYIVLVSHAGLELLDVPMPEWRSAYRYFIDNGVDVIIGHHPHVVQGWEAYQGGLIFYSLGNFLWKKSNDCKHYTTFVVGIHFSFDSIKYSVIPIEVNESSEVTLNTDSEYIRYLEELNSQLKEAGKHELNRKVDEFCMKLYKEAYQNYIGAACGLNISPGVKTYAIQIIKSILRKNKLDDLFMYHNVAVETNNWLYQRVIEYKYSHRNEEY